MNKSALKALFINAKSVGARYIGMRLTQTGIEKPEFHITQRENFDKMFEYFMKMYDYVQNNFRDKEYGEWYSILKRDGRMVSDYKGFELKGPYHVPRCLMQLVTLLEEYLEQKGKANDRHSKEGGKG